MKTMLTRELGSLDALEIVELPDDPVGEGQVRIEVLACGLNYVDALMIEGRYQIKPPVPYRPGSEVVGRVTETGPGVAHLRVGDRVFAPVGTGGFSDSLVIQAARSIPIPANLTEGQGATFMQSYLTAWFAFHERVQLREGATMLVLGAGGGVGLAAVDVAVSMGVRVIAAASSQEKRDLATAAGAFATIDVSTEDVKARARELSGNALDYVYDPVGGELAEQCLRALAPHGQYMVVGFVAGIPRLPANHVLLTNRTVVGVDWGAWMLRNQPANAAMLMTVIGELAAGRLHPVEPQTYPMSRAVDALRDMQNRKVAGKVALIPDFG